MKEEIAAAVFFVTRLVKRYGCVDNKGRERLAATLTSALFDKYKNHWDPQAPCKGQAYRCVRMNTLQSRDPVLELACIRSSVRYEDLGLPGELTLWVDPGEVSCRYGEHSDPFCVSVVQSSSSSSRRRADSEFSRRIQNAVDRAFQEVPSGGSSDEDDSSCSSNGSSRDSSMISSAGSSSSAVSGGSLSPPRSSLPSRPAQPQTIPTVSNPNSVYKMTEFSSGAPQSWVAYPKRKTFPGEGGFPPHPPPPAPHYPPPPPQQQHGSSYRPYVRPSFIFSGPRVDKYHWVSKSRS